MCLSYQNLKLSCFYAFCQTQNVYYNCKTVVHKKFVSSAVNCHNFITDITENQSRLNSLLFDAQS